jgi:hypothetical protein
MSNQQFPPAGVRCVDCGCCYANIYAGNDPLCWACDAGSHGPKKPAPTAPVKSSPVHYEIPAREEIRTNVAIAPATPVTPLHKEEKTVPKGFRPVGVPCAMQDCPNLAYAPNKYCTKKHYYYVQNPDKAPTSGKPAARSPRRIAVPATPASVARSIVHAPQPTAIAPASPIVITGEVSPAAAEKFWSILSVEQKRQIVMASIHSILNPAQEA